MFWMLKHIFKSNESDESDDDISEPEQIPKAEGFIDVGNEFYDDYSNNYGSDTSDLSDSEESADSEDSDSSDSSESTDFSDTSETFESGNQVCSIQ